MNNRLLFFDILRISAIVFIVISHVGLVNVTIDIPNIYSVTLGGFGVSILLFVSGAVLMYNYHNLLDNFVMSKFYIRRLLRIYPAYWLSLILGLILVPSLLSTPITDLFLQFSGFMSFTNNWGGPINAIGWYIGLLVVLYLLFPVLAFFFRNRPHLTILGLLIISIISRWIIFQYDLGFRMYDWLPLCRLFEFGFGIYLIRIGFFPKWDTKSNILIFFSELTFYIFLVNYMIRSIWRINPMFYLIAIIVLSLMLMFTDNRIQSFLNPYLTTDKKNVAVIDIK